LDRVGPVLSFGVNRKTIRRQVDTAVTPILTKGEQLRRSGPAWALEQRGRAPLLFRARDLYEVLLTDQRLILLSRPRRRRPLGVNNVVLAKRYSTFSLEQARRLRPLLQLRVRTSADRVLVLEFRPRDRRVARDLAAELAPSPGGRTDPVEPAPVPEPVRLEPPVPEPVRLEPPAPEPVRLEPPAEPVSFEPPAPEASDAPAGKLSRRANRRARKEEKQPPDETEERRGPPDRRKNWEGPPDGFERRSGKDRRSDWAKPSRKERRQARKDRKRNRGSDDIDIIEQLRQ
jgi:hypothetical protein